MVRDDQFAGEPGTHRRAARLPHQPAVHRRRACALDYVTELTTSKKVDPGTFQRLARYYGEREICDLVWLVASEHDSNLTNHGLGIGSDGLCELRPPKVITAPA